MDEPGAHRRETPSPGVLRNTAGGARVYIEGLPPVYIEWAGTVCPRRFCGAEKGRPRWLDELTLEAFVDVDIYGSGVAGARSSERGRAGGGSGWR